MCWLGDWVEEPEGGSLLLRRHWFILDVLIRGSSRQSPTASHNPPTIANTDGAELAKCSTASGEAADLLSGREIEFGTHLTSTLVIYHDAFHHQFSTCLIVGPRYTHPNHALASGGPLFPFPAVAGGECNLISRYAAASDLLTQGGHRDSPSALAVPTPALDICTTALFPPSVHDVISLGSFRHHARSCRSALSLTLSPVTSRRRSQSGNTKGPPSSDPRRRSRLGRFLVLRYQRMRCRAAGDGGERNFDLVKVRPVTYFWVPLLCFWMYNCSSVSSPRLLLQFRRQ